MPQAAYRAHKAHPRVLIMTFDNGVQEKVPLEQHVANYATSKFCLAPAGYGFSSRQYECVLVGCVPIIIQAAAAAAPAPAPARSPVQALPPISADLCLNPYLTRTF